MKLPFCPRCGAKSVLGGSKAIGFDLFCTQCDHLVIGHSNPEAAVKAFLWKHNAGRGAASNTDHTLACGCPKSGCLHKFFESTEIPLVAG